jgi:sugar phosphate isomerase/epimerase
MTEKEQTRRQFLQTAGIGSVVSLMGSGCSPSVGLAQTCCNSRRQLMLGLASYTLRRFELDETLAMTKRVGLEYICLKSMHLELYSTQAQIETTLAKVEEAGLVLYGGGVIYMRNEAQVHQAFDYAQAAGMKVIVGVPVPELLPLVNEMVQQYDIKVAIHNHGPTDKVYPVPSNVYEKIKYLDGRIGLCNDIGHTMRAGVDPAASIKSFADRLLDVHMKDVSQASAEGGPVEVGRGVIDIPEVIRALLEIDYKGIVSFEYEKDAEDPLAGLAESVGYVKGVQAAIS